MKASDSFRTRAKSDRRRSKKYKSPDVTKQYGLLVGKAYKFSPTKVIRDKRYAELK